jgi:sugar phosphate isomerase/epimerase
MNRREFLSETTAKGLSAMAIPFLEMPDFLKDVRMGIVVHSYATRWSSKIESNKYPGFANALELMEHCHSIGAGGLQVGVRNWTKDFSKKLRDRREKLGLYLEGSIAVPASAEDVSRFENEVIQAKEAGAVIFRTVTSGGRRYEAFHSAGEVETFKSKAMEALRLAEPVLRKHKAKLAVENHKDWRADELAHALKQLSSEWIGVTLDFGNSIALIEDPMKVVETLVPYIFTTHVKDMGVEEYRMDFSYPKSRWGKDFLICLRSWAFAKSIMLTLRLTLK